MKIAYIQYSGDFGETYTRLKSGHKENYYGQKYSVDTVVNQARSGIEVVVIVCKAKENYERKLEQRLSSVGIDKNINDWRNLVIDYIRKYSPDKVILRLPDWRLLKFLRESKIQVFPVFADSFEDLSWLNIKSRIGYYLLKRELKDSSIKWVANHQLNAARSIQSLGVKPSKILPYDWEHNQHPSEWQPCFNSDLTSGKLTLLYVGSLVESKGVGDAIKSLKYLNKIGRKANLRIIGCGENEKFESLSKAEGVYDNVKFLGLVENKVVRNEMNAADVVLVPSHHTYPEGLPMTIMESLLVQTPLVLSDHPMFKGRVQTGGAIEMVPEKNPKQLANKIALICEDVDMYKQRCINSVKEWENLTLGLKWANMVNKWLEDDDSFFEKYSLLAHDLSISQFTYESKKIQLTPINQI
jgi:glycosyltransferase involved in cell wall biosynthesis